MTTAIFAQPTQFYLEDNIGDGLQTRIYIIGEPQAKAEVQNALYSAVDHAREALKKMQSELNDINQKKAKGSYMVSEELARAVQTGVEIGEKTNGKLDITAPNSFPGSFKKIKANAKNNSLKLNADNIEINLSPILRGFLADLMAEDLVKAGWNNCLVKIGNVYVTRGNDVANPWTIPVVIPSERVAKKVYYYKTKQEQAAGATWTSVKDDSAATDLKSVTIFSKNGAHADGMASAVLKMGSAEGKKFLSQNKNIRAVLIDNEGNLTSAP